MDLSSFDSITAAEAGVEFEIVHPITRRGTGMFVTLRGTDSKIYWSAMEQHAQQARARGKTVLSIEDVRAQWADVLARCTVSWRGIEQGGTPLPCTFENARAMYSDYPFILDWARSCIEERSGFFPKPLQG